MIPNVTAMKATFFTHISDFLFKGKAIEAAKRVSGNPDVYVSHKSFKKFGTLLRFCSSLTVSVRFDDEPFARTFQTKHVVSLYVIPASLRISRYLPNQAHIQVFGWIYFPLRVASEAVLYCTRYSRYNPHVLIDNDGRARTQRKRLIRIG